jgi:O-methyltransferase
MIQLVQTYRNGGKKIAQEYDVISLDTSYCPWNVDEEFLRVFQVAGQNSLVDIYRCYELWQLVEQSLKLPHGDILEVGVWRGGTGLLIAQKMKLAGVCIDDCSLYLCDTFKGIVKSQEIDHHKDGEFSDTSVKHVMSLIHAFDMDEYVSILEGVFPDETGGYIQDSVFRFCHIDVDIYQSAVDITDWVWPKLVHGGIIVYDDYGFEKCKGITKHIEEQRSLPDRVIIHNINGHAVVIKL